MLRAGQSKDALNEPSDSSRELPSVEESEREREQEIERGGGWEEGGGRGMGEALVQSTTPAVPIFFSIFILAFASALLALISTPS